MATIVFTDNRTLEVAPQRAIRLMLIRSGKLAGNPDIRKYLKRVKAIRFDTAHKRPIVDDIRLPYKD